MLMCESIHMSLIVYWVVKIMVWMIWARLHFVCMLVIDVTALKELLEMSILSWLVISEIDIASSMVKGSAVFMLQKGASL